MKTAPSAPSRSADGVDSAIPTGNSREVGGIDDPQTATLRLLVDGNLSHAMTDAHLSGRDRHRHALADQLPGHRVAIRVDLDGTIVANNTG